MTILKEEIAKRVKGSLMENEDWWRLCYDTYRERFFIEHEWSYVDPYNVAKKPNSGVEEIDANAWTGPGNDKIKDAQNKLLARAK